MDKVSLEQALNSEKLLLLTRVIFESTLMTGSNLMVIGSSNTGSGGKGSINNGSGAEREKPDFECNAGIIYHRAGSNYTF